jgi:hypothetical protein
MQSCQGICGRFDGLLFPYRSKEDIVARTREFGVRAHAGPKRFK